MSEPKQLNAPKPQYTDVQPFVYPEVKGLQRPSVLVMEERRIVVEVVVQRSFRIF